MNTNKDIAIKLTNVKKKYKLGQIGGGTLQADLQSWWAKIHGKEDPNTKIGTDQRSNGETFMALNGVDLTIYKGEAIGIIGSNGAGKSTLLKLLSRVTAPSEGEIDIYGRIASMLEVGTGFNGEMTGRENVYMNGAILGMTKAEIDAKMEQIIEFSEVREFIDTPVKRYSSGMYVKLAFSVAAHLDSEIMIMDEVLAVGDMAFQKKCLDKMREAAKKEGRTVLYVSHNMNTIRQLCDRCIVLDKGKVKYEGDVNKAIELYLDNNEVLFNYCEYTKDFHINSKSVDSFLIHSLKVLGENKPYLDYKSTLLIELCCKAKKAWNNVNFRFEVKYQDDSTVGIMISNKSVNFKENDYKSIKFIVDTDHLAPGKYTINIVAYINNEFGVEQYLDGVYPGLLIEINDKLDENQKLLWLHQYWGSVRLHDIIIEDKTI